MSAVLRQWVSEGGTLILIKRAASWATQKPVALPSVQTKNKPAATQSRPLSRHTAVQISRLPTLTAELAAYQPADPSPGVFLRANVFREHWLTFGCPRCRGRVLPGQCHADAAGRVQGPWPGHVCFPDPSVLTSGFCWPETLEMVAETPYLLYESLVPGPRGGIHGRSESPGVMYPRYPNGCS